jgi:hypothetical protein
MSIDAYGRLPILPERTLRQHDAFEPSDSRFRAAARLQQSLWREQQGWKAGYQIGPDGKRRRLGNCLASRPAALGANFISNEVAKLARLELSFREEGALMDEERLWTNCLSSAPLCLNLFGPLRLDLKLATRVFRRLFPDYVRAVTAILFEHSPRRGDLRFTNDFSAFDALVQCQTKDGKAGFIAIEVKFSETLTEQPARLRPRYDELSQSCGCFKYPDNPMLRAAPLQQLWRQEMLAASMLQAGLYERGRFIVVAPVFNNQAQNAVALFRSQIADMAPVGFDAVTLESFVDMIGKAGATEIAASLHQRYCDFEPVASLV